MSQENVGVVRAAYRAWNAGDMDALREGFDPEAIIVRMPEGWPEPGPFVGRDAVMREVEQWRETFGSYETELVGDVIEAADRVVVRQVWHGVGQGPESHLESTVVFTLRKGRVFLMEYFWGHAEALETLGLSDQLRGLRHNAGTAYGETILPLRTSETDAKRRYSSPSDKWRLSYRPARLDEAFG